MPNTLLRFSTVKAKTGYPRSTLYYQISKGTFPTPVKLGERAVGLGCIRFSRHGLKRIAPPRTVPDSRSPVLNVGV